MGDTSGHRKVPKEIGLTEEGSGQAQAQPASPDTNLGTPSQVCHLCPSTPPPSGLTGSQTPPTPNGHGHRPKGNYTCSGTSLLVKDVCSAPACLGLNLSSATSLGLRFPLCKVGEMSFHLLGGV